MPDDAEPPRCIIAPDDPAACRERGHLWWRCVLFAEGSWACYGCGAVMWTGAHRPAADWRYEDGSVA